MIINNKINNFIWLHFDIPYVYSDKHYSIRFRSPKNGVLFVYFCVGYVQLRRIQLTPVLTIGLFDVAMSAFRKYRTRKSTCSYEI